MNSLLPGIHFLHYTHFLPCYLSMENYSSVFVAGCDSEIGFAVARLLVDKGHNVLAAMKSPGFINQIYAADLLEHANNRKGQMNILEMDVTSNSSVQFAIDEAYKLTDNGIDVLVNVEDAGAIGFSETFTVEQFKNIFDLNVFGFQRLCRAILPRMREQQEGFIINVSSLFSRFTLPYAGAYTAAKYALNGLVESYQRELEPVGIDVSIVETGAFDASVIENMHTMPDDLTRVKSYGELEYLPRRAWNEIVSTYQFDDKDPAVVARAIGKLVALSKEERPRRIVVNGIGGAKELKALNKKKATLQERLLAPLSSELELA